MKIDQLRSIVLKLVVASILAAAIPACSLEAERVKVKMDRVRSVNDACQATETLKEQSNE